MRGASPAPAPMSVSLESALPEARAARRAFDRARGFDEACVVHDETRQRLIERLDFFRLTPRVAVDLGCATGRGALALALRYPAARVLAIDSSAAMLRAARTRCAAVAAIAPRGGRASRDRWRAFERELAGNGDDARFGVTIEIVLGQAFGGGSRPAVERGPLGEVAVPLARVGRRGPAQ